MKIDLLAVGKQMPDWVNRGVNEYLQRFPPHLKIDLLEITAAKRSKNGAPWQYKKEEARNLLAKIPADNHVIALDVKGKMLSTPELAKQLQFWLSLGKNCSLLIGGPDGLDESCLQRADLHWSLSTLTFPHPLVRIILAEQLYRAWSLLNNHPYHRE